MKLFCSRQFGKSILQTVYGFDDNKTLEYFIDLNERMLEMLLEIVIPGTYWVDFIPWLKHVPAWVPGAVFQKRAAQFRQCSRSAIEEPFQTALMNRTVRYYFTIRDVFSFFHAFRMTNHDRSSQLFLTL